MQLTKTCSTASISTLGLLAFSCGAYFDALDIGGDIRQIGSMLLVGALVRTWCIRPLRPQSDAFAQGYQQGLDQGWTQGHRAARPVVVPIRIFADANLPAPPEPAHSARYQGAHNVG
jgi:hypothetical protein